MNIDPKIKDAHEHLSRLNTQFLEYAFKNPLCLKSSNFPLLDLKDELFVLQPWPTFIKPEIVNEIKRAALTVFDLIRSIPSRIFSDDYKKLSDYFQVSEDLARYLLEGFSKKHIDNLAGRGDFVLSPGGWKCIEYNINTNLGGSDIPLWEPLYLNTPIIQNFTRANDVKIKTGNLSYTFVNHLVKNALAAFPDSKELNVTIVHPDYAGDPMNSPSHLTFVNTIHKRLLGENRNLTGDWFMCSYPHLTVSRGNVYLGNKRIHSLVEWTQGFVTPGIMGSYKSGNILVYDGMISFLLSVKSTLALLSELEDSELLNPGEKEIIRRYIPWTRKVAYGETTYKSEKVRLESFLISNRENLVLKPTLGTGGQGIYIGRYTPADRWEKIVETALAPGNWLDLHVGSNVTHNQWIEMSQKATAVKNWIVQEYIESYTYLYQDDRGANGCSEHHTVWGFFVFGSEYGGSWVRTLPIKDDRGIINCHQGAKVSVVFEVDR
jgi:hypothetical protein